MSEPKIGDVVDSLAGLPVGTWASDNEDGFWVITVGDDDGPIEDCNAKWAVCAVQPDWFAFREAANQYGPFNICRPPVGAVLPSARYAPVGTWLRDNDGDVHMVVVRQKVHHGSGTLANPWRLPNTAPFHNDKFAPFTVIDDPREGAKTHTVNITFRGDVARGAIDAPMAGVLSNMHAMATGGNVRQAQPVPIRDDAGNITGVEPLVFTGPVSPDDQIAAAKVMAMVPISGIRSRDRQGLASTLTAEARRRLGSTKRADRTGHVTTGAVPGLGLTGSDLLEEGMRRPEHMPEPMPRVDLITTGGDQSWRKARPVSRKRGPVSPVCGWAAYWGDE